MAWKRKAKRIPAQQRSESGEKIIWQRGFGTEMPPELKMVEIYFDQKDAANEAAVFFQHYEAANWCSLKGTPYKNWKLLATDWIFESKQSAKLKERQRNNALL